MNEQVFISYSRKDTDWALRIKNTLESNGVSCWMDKSGINAGERYTRSIIDAIRQCDIFLLVLSEHAEASQWVPKELGKAIQYRKYIIPVKISNFEVEEFELQLENIQIFELENLSEIQAQITLVNTIKAVLKLKPADEPEEQDEQIEASDDEGWEGRGNRDAGTGGPAQRGSSDRNSSGGTAAESSFRAAPRRRGRTSETASPQPGGASPSGPEVRLPALTAELKKKLAAAAAVILVLAVGGSSIRLFQKPSGDGETGAVSAGAGVDGSDTDVNGGSGADTGKTSSDDHTGDTPSGEAVQLCSLHIMNSVHSQIKEDVVNSAGQTFDQAVYALGSGSANYATFYLGSSYSRFTGTVSCPDELSNSSSYTFKVFLDDDDKKPAAEFSMSRSTPPTLLDIDVTGHDTITFWVSKDYLGTGFIISDGQLYETDGQVSESLSVNNAIEAEDTLLVSQHMMSSAGAKILEDVVNSAGQVFDKAVWATGSYKESYATFYLGGNYSRFMGTVSCPDTLNNKDSYTFMVFLDDDKKQPAAEITLGRSTPPTLLDIDTAGHDTITFRAAKGDGDTGFVISDGRFYTDNDPAPDLVLNTAISAEDTMLTSHHLMKSKNASIQEDVVNSAGQTFGKAVVASGAYSSNLASFYLGQNYTRFIGTLSCPDQIPHGESYRFAVYLDNDSKQPAAEFTVSRSTPPTLLDIDVTGHDTITFWAANEDKETGFVISDGQFYRPGDKIPSSPSVDTTVASDDSLLTSQHLMKSVNASIREDAVNSAGQVFHKAVVAIGPYANNTASFYLGQNYTRFIGTVSCPDDMPHAGSYKFMVFLDDDQKNPVAEFTMSRSTPPTLLDIDVTGHDTITFWAPKEDNNTGFLISDGQLYGPDDQIPDTPSVNTAVTAPDTALTSQHLMKSKNASIQTDAMNSAGQVFDKAVVAVGSYSENLASFYLGQNYSRFTGTISCPENISHGGNYTFMIYLDDDKKTPAAEFTMNRDSSPVPVDIDLTGHETITFWASQDNKNTGFVISDGQLIP